MDISVEQHLALLLADGLRFTKEITPERKQDLIDALTSMALGQTTDEILRETLKRMLDHGWEVTAPFTPEFVEALREATD